MSKNQRRLSRPEAFKLADWIKEHHVGLKQMNPTYLETAKKAEKDLGFAICPGTLSSIAKELGLDWGGNQGANKTGKTTLTPRVQLLEQRVQRIMDFLEMDKDGEGATT